MLKIIKKKRKIYGIKMKKYITYKMCSIPICFYEWMILTCIISKLKGKIRGPPVKSYVMMPEISDERFLEILKNKNRFLCILCEKATHISWWSHHDSGFIISLRICRSPQNINMRSLRHILKQICLSKSLPRLKKSKIAEKSPKLHI